MLQYWLTSIPAPTSANLSVNNIYNSLQHTFKFKKSNADRSEP